MRNSTDLPDLRILPARALIPHEDCDPRRVVRLSKRLEADGILIGSPVYTGSVPGILKALLERTSYLSHTTGRSLERKVGAPIVVAGRAGHNFTHAELLMWFHITGFYMVGSSYWNVAIGLNKGDVHKDIMAFRTLDHLTDNFVYLLRLLQDDA